MAVSTHTEYAGFHPKNVISAVTPCGQLTIPSIYSPILEESSLYNVSVKTLCLNRPESLHALDTTMCKTLYSRIRRLRTSETKCVILKSTTPSRAFCAGGDVRRLSFLAEKHQYTMISEFFRTEYRLNSLLGCMQTPDVVSILDGIVMGGGTGLSMHGAFRVATENTVFAVPEVAIGFHPDVGASHFLSRLSAGLGTYLALTGAQLQGEQVLLAGIATHFVPRASVSRLMEAVQATHVQSKEDIQGLLRSFSHIVSPSKWDKQFLSAVAELFAFPSVETIIEALKKTSLKSNSIHNSFASNSLRAIQKRCPLSLKVTFESLRRGSTMRLDDCLKMEFTLSNRLTRRADFVQGVRAVLITKDNNAEWSPAQLSDISHEDVSKCFQPLTDMDILELDLSHDLDDRSRTARL